MLILFLSGSFAPQDEAVDQAAGKAGGTEEADDSARTCVWKFWWRWWYTLGAVAWQVLVVLTWVAHWAALRYARLTFLRLTFFAAYGYARLTLLDSRDSNLAAGRSYILYVFGVNRNGSRKIFGVVGVSVGYVSCAVGCKDSLGAPIAKVEDIRCDVGVLGAGAGSELVSVVALAV